MKRTIIGCVIGLVSAGLVLPTFAQSGLFTARAATQQVTLTGFTRARTELMLASEVAGKVDRVFADIGEPIPADGRFACLDETFIDLEIETNLANQARLRADIAYFEKQVTRHRKLVKQNSSAQTQLDDFERSLTGSRQQLAALLVENKILVERRRRYCITAPPGWLVTERQIEPGQWVNVGQSVGKLGDFSRLLVPFALSMPEYQALRTAAGNLQMHLPDLATTVSAGLERVSPAFDEQSRKIRLDLQVSDGLPERRGGLRAELNLQLPAPSGAVLVPKSALEERYEEFWLQRPDGEQVRVVYLGPATSVDGSSQELVRVASPDVRPGDQFRLRSD